MQKRTSTSPPSWMWPSGQDIPPHSYSNRFHLNPDFMRLPFTVCCCSSGEESVRRSCRQWDAAVAPSRAQKGAKMTAEPQPRFLVLFDFDETLVNKNSDDAVLQALPGQRLPDWLKNSYREGHYNEHMQQILAYMAEQGVTRDAIRSALEAIPPAPGALALLRFLQSRQHDFEMAVLSDANMYFIDTWLKRAGVRQLFRKIFTNPASFDAGGRLVLLPFHAHSCPRCPGNMCKQVILREYLALRQKERGAPFQQVFYVGDGANDVCPSLVLGPRDTVFPRKDFPMHTMLKSEGAKFKANMVPWNSGQDVKDCLEKIVEQR